MKKILLLALVGVAVLSAGCEQPHKQNTTTTTVYHDAVLTISNQTSTDFSSVMYNGNKKDSGSPPVGGSNPIGWKETKYGTALEKGQAWKAVQNETPCSSYIYFTVGSVKARTDELITLEKGETKIFTFTDNTLVVKDGEQKAITVLALLNSSTVLTIQNNTSRPLSAVTYAGRHPETINDSLFEPYTIGKNEQGNIKLDDACTAVLYFDIETYQLKTVEKISISKGERKLYIIDGDTMVIREGAQNPNRLSNYL